MKYKMPRGFYNWTAEGVVRFLKARGFILNHTKGSYYYYIGRYSGAFRQVCVPFYGSKTIFFTIFLIPLLVGLKRAKGSGLK